MRHFKLRWVTRLAPPPARHSAVAPTCNLCALFCRDARCRRWLRLACCAVPGACAVRGSMDDGCCGWGWVGSGTNERFGAARLQPSGATRGALRSLV